MATRSCPNDKLLTELYVLAIKFYRRIKFLAANTTPIPNIE